MVTLILFMRPFLDSYQNYESLSYSCPSVHEVTRYCQLIKTIWYQAVSSV